MADKEKRLRKILDKIYMKGLLKSVGTLEEAHIVLVDYPEEPTKYGILKKGNVSTGISEWIHLSGGQSLFSGSYQP